MGYVAVCTLPYATPARMARMSSSSSPAAMPCVAGPTIWSVVIVPVTVAGGGGHAWVPAGPLPRFEHRNAETPPVTPSCPKWMCACWTAPPSRSS